MACAGPKSWKSGSRVKTFHSLRPASGFFHLCWCCFRRYTSHTQLFSAVVAKVEISSRTCDGWGQQRVQSGRASQKDKSRRIQTNDIHSVCHNLILRPPIYCHPQRATSFFSRPRTHTSPLIYVGPLRLGAQRTSQRHTALWK